MKLHLPTALFALAVLPAVAFAEMTYTIDDVKADFSEVDLTKSEYYLDGHLNLIVGTHNGSPDLPFITNPKNEVLKIDGDLNMTNGDKIDYKNSPAINQKTQVLFIDGDVNLRDGATVNIQGHAGMLLKGGMIAKDVTVDGNGSKLALTAARFDSLTVKNGTVSLHAETYDNGGSIYGAGTDYGYTHNSDEYSGMYEFASVTVSGALKVEGGEVEIGYPPTAKHSSYRAYTLDRAYQSTIGGTVHQTDGTLKMYGRNYFAQGIKQDGGNMFLGLDHDTNGRKGSDYLVFGSNKVTIEQTADSSGTLELKGIIAHLTDDGLGKVAHKGGAGEMKLEIIQNGHGTINMTPNQDWYKYDSGSYKCETDKYLGSVFKTGNGPASEIIQTADGKININGDYSSATFNVKQTGTGTITIGEHGVLKSSALTLTDAATFSVVKGGQLKLDDATLSYTVTNFDDSITSTAGAAVYNEGPVVSMINAGSVSGTIVSVGVALSDEAFAAYTMKVDALATGVVLSSFSVTLATGLAEETVTFDPAAVGITTEATYTVGGESVTVAYDVENVIINDAGNLVATVGARVTAVGGSTPAVPEPATATLSLLALAGLCARRRRK